MPSPAAAPDALPVPAAASLPAPLLRVSAASSLGRLDPGVRRDVEADAAPRAVDDVASAVRAGEERDGVGVPPAGAEPDVRVGAGAVVVAVEGEHAVADGEVALALPLGAGDEADRVAEGDLRERSERRRAAVGGEAAAAGNVGVALGFALLERKRADGFLRGERSRSENGEARQRERGAEHDPLDVSGPRASTGGTRDRCGASDRTPSERTPSGVRETACPFALPVRRP